MKDLFKFFFKPYSYPFQFLKFFFQKTELDEFLSTFFKKYKNAKIYQLGANDGISGDPLFKYMRVLKLTNLAVEPIPFLYDSLKENYFAANLKSSVLLPFAISSKEYETIYFFEKNLSKEIPSWVYQLGTFNSSALVKLVDKYPNLILKDQKVLCTTVSKLQSLYFTPDLIHIDTEGFDFEVIKTIDFEKKTKVIIYEHIHLSDVEKQNCE